MKRKRFMGLALGCLCLMLSISSSAFATSEGDGINELTTSAKSILVDEVGVSQEELEGLPSSAQPTEAELNAYLTSAGYPANVISLFELDTKVNLYNNQGTFVGIEETVGNLVEGKDGQLSLTVAPRSLANFTGSLVGSSITAPSGYKKFLLDYYWDWKYQPNYTLTDKFGISWSDDFDAIPATAVYNYKAIHNGNQLPHTYCEKATGNISTYTDYTIKKGIGWSADIIQSYISPTCKDDNGLTGNNFSTEEHKGWGEVAIQKAITTPGQKMSSAAVADYFHKQGAVTGSLSFNPITGSVTIEIAGSTNYDKSPDIAYQWNWTQ
ncbi:hypothetical protein Back11_37950 [Paenibacillus baekrokdamisoli]|uniref:Uncharacterized protein n=1 Tax=Paenibacillus baekrokdamisoli TaxID=1712516 RepID=A0A3G9IU95_9BACL|nr:hypothetical protein [Paenibacillus baekrokdamisoli]MBB3068510.1 hypothetical protein [Paenibacillus baekrokdamisoli]BBH22450.1 hypothetical protein Back11_37950 [Paenibacillus baekrokdamisoli]